MVHLIRAAANFLECIRQNEGTSSGGASTQQNVANPEGACPGGGDPPHPLNGAVEGKLQSGEGPPPPTDKPDAACAEVEASEFSSRWRAGYNPFYCSKKRMVRRPFTISAYRFIFIMYHNIVRCATMGVSNLLILQLLD